MTRTSRVPYHQNVYDLLGLEPTPDSKAVKRIATHETKHGPIPAAVREWYTVPKAMPITRPRGVRVWNHGGSLWYEISSPDYPLTLVELLRAIRYLRPQQNRRDVRIAHENQGVVSWWVEMNETEDPPVWCDNDRPEHRAEWTLLAERFTAFVFSWFSGYGFDPDFGMIGKDKVQALLGKATRHALPHLNRLWLRSPDEPFAPPVIDFLIDQFGEADRTPRPGDVTTYTFRPPGGLVRVTADHPALTGGLSAWWVHADTPERLADLARLLAPWGTLRDTLRADTDPARAVLTATLRSSA